MKTDFLVRSVLLALSLGVARVHAALEWEQQEIALEVRRGAQEDVRAEFNFKNAGKKAVTILGISTSCGCTVAQPDSNSVPAGGKSRIRTLFTLGNRSGRQEKRITVETDDPASARVVLVLTIDILEPPAAAKAG